LNALYYFFFLPFIIIDKFDSSNLVTVFDQVTESLTAKVPNVWEPNKRENFLFSLVSCISFTTLSFAKTLPVLSDSKDNIASQHYDEESNPSGKKSNNEKKKPTSFCGWIKQIWSKIEGDYHTFFMYEFCREIDSKVVLL